MKKGMLGFLAVTSGAIVGAIGVGYLKNRTITAKLEKVDKFKGYYNLLNQWLINKNSGKNAEKYFVEHGYKKIAIYGMGEMGNRLYDELKDTCIEVKYAIDKNADNTYSELDVFGLDDNLENVDAVVVTATFAFDEIEEKLGEKIDFPIISLEEVIYGV